MDTPGLADRRLLKQAAEAITTALKQSETYKIFFVIRLESGRVVADDLLTIETVMSSIDLKEVPFTIIINNIKKRQYNAMMEEEEFKRVATLVNTGKYTTPHVMLIPTLPELDEEEDAITALPSHAARFIQQEAPSIVINAEDVSEVRSTGSAFEDGN
ncbi:hypothetical protein V7S43_010660 [Phytophthora oleae]|uniref:AIG1-type G domain-containing protein n=1 Tax=Phytophthora oleae TaxID=2107226 RepID=A0ABD3FDG3_9STRA